MTLRLVLSSFLAIFFTTFWFTMAEYNKNKIRGLHHPELIQSEKHTSEKDLLKGATFCNLIPQCFRPGTMMGIYLVHHYIAKPFAFLSNTSFLPDGWDNDHRLTELKPANISVDFSVFIFIATCFFLSFSLLFFSFPTLIASLAVISFGMSPTITGWLGLTARDSFILVYCNLAIISILGMINYSDHEFMRGQHKNIKKYFFICFAMGVMGTWINENLGVAYGISLFIMAMLHKLKFSSCRSRPWWPMYFGATVGTLVAGLITWLMVQRHQELHWFFVGKDYSYGHDLYTKTDSLLGLFTYLYREAYLAIYLSIFLGFILLVLGPRMKLYNKEKFGLMSLVSLSFYIGFVATCLVGFFMYAGFNMEWRRQLLPAGLIATWVAFSASPYLAERLRAYLMNNINRKIKNNRIGR